MPDIFLSYNRDDQATARRFAEGFEREGFSVWWDATLNPGEAYDEVTEKALLEARAVVVLWSKKSVTSRWVRAEATQAHDNKTLVPVMIEPCKRPIMFELTHTADLSHWTGDRNDKAWQSYVAGVRLFVERGGASPSASQPAGQPPRHGRFGVRSISILIAAVLLIAGGVLWLFLRGRITLATTSIPRTSVAVMPFANLTGDASKDYLGDGMSEELLNALSKVPGLKVPSRTSSFSYKGRNTDLKQIASDLHVGTILEGSVRSAGETLRISAELIDAQTDTHLWSETYTRKFSDLFQLQDDLTRAIVQALQVNLNGASPESLTQAPPTRDVEAYNLTMQGYSLQDPATEERAVRALALFTEAVARDPRYAHAHAGIAWSHFMIAMMQGSASGLPLAVRAAQQALSLDPNDSEAHTVLGTIEQDRGWLPAEPHWRAALRSAPGDARSHDLYVWQLFFVGHIRDALEQARQAYALAPASPFALNRLSMSLSQTGATDEALRLADRAVELGNAKEEISNVYLLAALRARSPAQTARLLQTEQGTARSRLAELTGLVAAARVDPSRRPAAYKARDRLFPINGPQSSAPGLVFFSGTSECIASAYVVSMLGDQDVAYKTANQCLDASKHVVHEAGIANLYFLWTPELRPFRRDPRFQAYVSRIGDLMEYWQQYGPPDDCDLAGGRLTCH